MIYVYPSSNIRARKELDKMAGFDGMSYEDMIDLILKVTEARLFPENSVVSKNGSDRSSDDNGDK